MPLSQPIRNKTKTNCDLLALIFPGLVPATDVHVFARSSNWFIRLSASSVIGESTAVITLVLVLRHSIDNCSNTNTSLLQMVVYVWPNVHTFSLKFPDLIQTPVNTDKEQFFPSQLTTISRNVNLLNTENLTNLK